MFIQRLLLRGRLPSALISATRSSAPRIWDSEREREIRRRLRHGTRKYSGSSVVEQMTNEMTTAVHILYYEVRVLYCANFLCSEKHSCLTLAFRPKAAVVAVEDTIFAAYPPNLKRNRSCRELLAGPGSQACCLAWRCWTVAADPGMATPLRLATTPAYPFFPEPGCWFFRAATHTHINLNLQACGANSGIAATPLLSSSVFLHVLLVCLIRKRRGSESDEVAEGMPSLPDRRGGGDERVLCVPSALDEVLQAESCEGKEGVRIQKQGSVARRPPFWFYFALIALVAKLSSFV